MSAASATASASHFLFRGLRLFKWNEKLSKNNVPDDQGLFLFTVHNNKNSSKKMNVIAFDSNELIYRWPMSCSSTVLGALQDTRFVKSSSDAESLSDEIAEYMSICLFLTMDSVFLPACSSPCLVFAVDLLEVEGVDGRLHPGTDHPNLITASLSMSLIDVGTCTSRDQILVALVSRKVLHVAFSREVADVPEDPMCLDDIDYPSDLDDEESDHVDSAMDDDAVEEEKEEFAEVAGVLRSWRGMDRTTPVVPHAEDCPVGLILVEPKLEIILEAATLTSGGSLGEDVDGCPICLDRLDDEKKMAMNANIRTKCGHVFYRRCIDNWLRDPRRWSCPLCRSCCVTDV